NQLLDLGNPQAWRWLVEHTDKLLVDNGIDLYRQDFNMDPLEFWRAHDDADRQGITENKHVVGYLAFWDELRRCHPNMLIDSCASGGRRNDLETMRRAVPLWRSDYAYEPIGHQGMTYGLSLWLPYHGTGTVATVDAPYYGGGFTPVQPYAFWSNAAPSLGSGIDVRVDTIDYPALQKLYAAWRELSEFYYGDFYPLTPYSQADQQWMGWQFNRPERGDGAFMAFRHAKAGESVRVKLRGLDPAASYRIDSIDAADSYAGRRFTGRELMEEGVEVLISTQPGAAVYRYRRG
ncbi:MAG TPA: alpha-galactosidase, partial [Fimbriimonadaceae bacterium]|nr:alpha-galactosidase [Fimbriimonadaceae bacterium]